MKTVFLEAVGEFECLSFFQQNFFCVIVTEKYVKVCRQDMYGMLG